VALPAPPAASRVVIFRCPLRDFEGRRCERHRFHRGNHRITIPDPIYLYPRSIRVLTERREDDE